MRRRLLPTFAFGASVLAATNSTITSCGCSPQRFAAPAIKGIEFLSVQAYLVKNHTFVNPELVNATAADYFTFCNLTYIYTHPGWHDAVTLITYLPDDWNGRFLALGGGGMAAGGEALLYLESTIITVLGKKFAVSTTDGGHPSDLEAAVDVNPPWVFTSPGNIDLPMLTNFASRSLHDMALLGKAIVNTAYGAPPKFSYFFGGSTGGMQGHMLAQRYPEDFDGIVAYKPTINWDKFFFSNVYAKLTMDTTSQYPQPCELDGLSVAAVTACDELDGVKDGIISRPDLCDFDPRKLVGQAFDCNGSPSTYSSIATEVAHATWTGPRSPTGEFRWYGFNKDVSLHANGTGPAALECNGGRCSAATFHMSDLWLRYFFAKDASLNLANTTRQQFDDLFLAAVNEYSSIIGAADPDLSRFRRAGGKMLSWHGMADQLIPLNGSTDYYDKVLAKDPQAHDFYRLFLAPGADHAGMGISVTEEVSLDYVMSWVETGKANETLSAAGMTGLGEEAKRDLCMFPKVQHYKGGDPLVPSSFVCA